MPRSWTISRTRLASGPLARGECRRSERAPRAFSRPVRHQHRHEGCEAHLQRRLESEREPDVVAMAALSPSREVLGRAEEGLERAAGGRVAIVGISLPGPDDDGAWVDRAERAAVVAGRDPDRRVAETADG